MPAGQNGADGYRVVAMINGNFTNLVSGLPLDSTKSTYLQANSISVCSRRRYGTEATRALSPELNIPPANAAVTPTKGAVFAFANRRRTLS